MNETHWEKFYKRPHTLEPSPFAIACNFSGHSILDIGCGNGRDTLYFAQKNAVIGIDRCAPEGEHFQRADITEWLREHPEAFGIDTVYCRFLLHAVDESTQNAIFDWAASNHVALFLEFRTIYDSPLEDHQRRLIDGNKLLLNLIARGFYVVTYEEGQGFAKYEDEDPMVARITAYCAPTEPRNLAQEN